MADMVTIQREGDVFILTLDDGKANALSHEVIASMGEALTAAEEGGAKALVIAGRPWRGTINGVAQLMFFFGLGLTPLAKVAARPGQKRQGKPDVTLEAILSRPEKVGLIPNVKTVLPDLGAGAPDGG